jgi:molybdenum cofactor cytidylyltransferase
VHGALVAKVRAAFDPASGRNICVAAAHGEWGHPVLWARKFFPRLMQLTGDSGARGLMLSCAQDIAEVEAGNAAPLRDIDTPAELDAFLTAR